MAVNCNYWETGGQTQSKEHEHIFYRNHSRTKVSDCMSHPMSSFFLHLFLVNLSTLRLNTGQVFGFSLALCFGLGFYFHVMLLASELFGLLYIAYCPWCFRWNIHYIPSVKLEITSKLRFAKKLVVKTLLARILGFHLLSNTKMNPKQSCAPSHSDWSGADISRTLWFL